MLLFVVPYWKLYWFRNPSSPLTVTSLLHPLYFGHLAKRIM